MVRCGGILEWPLIVGVAPECQESTTHLKKVFSPDIGVEASSQILAIPEYACGLILSFALISNENPNFEMGSNSARP
jgi:hypothetical protein